MEEAAMIIGTMAGALVASMGVVSLIGVKVWQALKKILPAASDTKTSLDEALGEREPEAPDGDDSGDRQRRRKTGSFQAVVREEFEHHLGPLERQVGRLSDGVASNGTAIAELTKGHQGQARLIAELARSHSDVAARTNEHSAALNIAKADQSTTSGAVQE